jgi:hypothetical protein
LDGAVAAGANRLSSGPGSRLVPRAAAYLWRQQAADGGWHSHTYGLLRSGQSLTPFVLEALLEVPGRVYPLPRAKVGRAIAFIREQDAKRTGRLESDDPGIPDYPNYATASGGERALPGA